MITFQIFMFLTLANMAYLVFIALCVSGIAWFLTEIIFTLFVWRSRAKFMKCFGGK